MYINYFKTMIRVDQFDADEIKCRADIFNVESIHFAVEENRRQEAVEWHDAELVFHIVNVVFRVGHGTAKD